MSWALVLTPEKVCAVRNDREIFVIEIRDWASSTLIDAIHQVERFMSENHPLVQM